MTAAARAEVQPCGMTDATLVRRALDGDPRAFAALVDRHVQPCLRFAARMLGNRQDAEDATQETLVRAHRALSSYESHTAFRTWLFAILVNRCRTALLRRSRYGRRVVTDDEALRGAVSSDDGDAIALRVEIARAVATLEPEQREAFLLKHVEQLSYEEMVEITGAGLSALKMRVKRACERLQLALREVYDGKR